MRYDKKQYAMSYYCIFLTYFFITADLGGGEKWTFIFVNEMKQTKTWGKENLDISATLNTGFNDGFVQLEWDNEYNT